MRRIALFILIALGCVFLAPVYAQPGETAGVEVPFEPIFSGLRGGAKRRGNMVIKNAAEWKRVFDISVASLMYKPELPEVDFSHKMLVAVLLGEQIAIDRGVKVHRVVRTPKALVVEYEATRGATRDVSGMAVTSTSQPFFFVAVPRTDLPVRFVDVSPKDVRDVVVVQETNTYKPGDPGGRSTGTIDDLATAERGVVQEDKIAIVGATDPGQRLLADGIGQNRVAVNLAWTLACALPILAIPVGFALLNLGQAHRANAPAVMLAALGVPAVALLGYWATGWALMCGAMGPVPDLGGLAVVADPSARLEIPGLGSVFAFRGFGLTDDMYDVGVGAMFILQAAYLAAALAIPAALLVGRVKPIVLLAGGFLFSMLLYPLLGHWTWGGGWLSQMGQTSHWSLGCGFVDFAGAGVVHACGGLAALAALVIIGPRQRKSPPNLPIPAEWLQLVLGLPGAVILAGGYLAANLAGTFGTAGEGNLRAGLVATTVCLAAAGGFAAAAAYGYAVNRRVTPLGCVNGLVAGVVAVSGAAAFFSPTAGLIIGALGGLLACLAASILETRGIDDPLNLIGTHAIGGLWGTLAVGIFADGTFGNGWNSTLINRQPVPLVGILYGGMAQFLAQILGNFTIALWAFGFSYLVLLGLRRLCDGLTLPEPAAEPASEPYLMEVRSAAVTMPVTGDWISSERVLADEEALPSVKPTGVWNGRLP